MIMYYYNFIYEIILNNQRLKGRPGSMLGVDRKSANVKKRRLSRGEKLKTRIYKYLENLNTPIGTYLNF